MSRGWTPGIPGSPIKVLDFEPPAGPNGSCLLAPDVMLFADCVEGLIWRVDLSDDGLHATARVWLQHDTMAAGAGRPPVKFSATMEVPFPSINGLRYGPKTNCVYYSCSSQELFMRVARDMPLPETGSLWLCSIGGPSAYRMLGRRTQFGGTEGSRDWNRLFARLRRKPSIRLRGR
jgi:hypothetical protein